jgi:hypothetical protein
MYYALDLLCAESASSEWRCYARSPDDRNFCTICTTAQTSTIVTWFRSPQLQTCNRLSKISHVWLSIGWTYSTVRQATYPEPAFTATDHSMSSAQSHVPKLSAEPRDARDFRSVIVGYSGVIAILLTDRGQTSAGSSSSLLWVCSLVGPCLLLIAPPPYPLTAQVLSILRPL